MKALSIIKNNRDQRGERTKKKKKKKRHETVLIYDRQGDRNRALVRQFLASTGVS